VTNTAAPKINEHGEMAKHVVWLNNYQFKLRQSERGQVVSLGDGIVWIKGLPSAAIDELLEFEDGSSALVFYLTSDLIAAALLRQTEKLRSGNSVYHSGKILSVPVSNELLGRVVDPLGFALDGGTSIKYEQFLPMDVLSPTIIERDFVSKPLYTGNKIVDNLVPIGKGQRELLIGDNGLGKTSLAIDTIVNQKNKDVYCVYVAIGQKEAAVKNLLQILADNGALEYTIIVVAEATALPGLQYLAPYAGCAIAEYWMKKGKDALIVYDDLTTHADCYRELSLLLKRAPGREAYPADIFHLHARLLERSTCLAPHFGGGSMTALPIIETKQGEIASYIPTNLISITDGQIYFSSKLFDAGFLPAIDVTRSVSRIGGKAQDQKVKEEAAAVKLNYLQFLELEEFTKLGAKLDPETMRKITHGKILRELLKQPRLQTLSIEQQLALFIAYNDGLFDNIALTDVVNVASKLQDNVAKCDLHLGLERRQCQTQVQEQFGKLMQTSNEQT
jgi:F-type H+-transporting ATPase subunit alpha